MISLRVIVLSMRPAWWGTTHAKFRKDPRLEVSSPRRNCTRGEGETTEVFCGQNEELSIGRVASCPWKVRQRSDTICLQETVQFWITSAHIGQYPDLPKQ